MPKGVMWRQDDLFGVLDANNRKRMPPEQDLNAIEERVSRPRPTQYARSAADARHRAVQRDQQSDGRRQSITTMDGPTRSSAEEFLDTVQQYGVNSTSIVGDAFAKPILRRS